MRKTKYAIELSSVNINDCRIEKLLIRKTNVEEIRFSWWPNGKFAVRPLDLPENDLKELLFKGFDEEVISKETQKQIYLHLKEKFA